MLIQYFIQSLFMRLLVQISYLSLDAFIDVLVYLVMYHLLIIQYVFIYTFIYSQLLTYYLSTDSCIYYSFSDLSVCF